MDKEPKLKFRAGTVRSAVRHALGGGVVIAGLLFAGEVFSQTAASAAGDNASDDLSLTEITVTARRKNENLEKVPVAVSAFSSTDIVEQKIATESDLETSTPGLTVRQTNSSNQLEFALRGQAEDAFSYSSATVLTYLNEFQVTGGNSASAFYDMQSIQVLKGPQGTLFGRNATGGAVLYQTAAPTQVFEGYARVGGGSYNDKQGEFMVNLPMGEVAALRVAGEFEKRDGYEHNLLLNLYEGSIDQKNMRATFLVKPFDGFENSTLFQYSDSLGYSTGLKIQNAYAVGQTNNGNVLNPTAAALYPVGSAELPGFNGIASVLTQQQKIGFYDFYNDTTSAHDADDRIVVNKSTYTLSPDLTIKNIAGFHDLISHDQTDVDGSPYPVLVIGAVGGPTAEGYTTTSRQYSDEVQLGGLVLADKLNYIVGAYFSRDDEGDDIPLNVATDFPTGGLYGPGIRDNFVSKDISRALYTQETYEFIPDWHATAGYRQTWETVTIQHLDNDTNRLSGVPDATTSESKPSWTLGVDYQVTPEELLYVAQRGSWRVGGFNGTSTVPNPAGGVNLNNEFKPETTYDFEIGTKFTGRIAGFPTRINVAIYDQTVNNIQRAVYLGVAAQTSNAKKARTSGVELQSQLELTHWLQVGANFAYTDARYINGEAIAIDTAGVSHDLDLGPYGDTSKETGSAYFRIAPRLPNSAGDAYFRTEIYSQSEFFYTNLANTLTPGTRIPGYSIVNMRLGWNDIYQSKVSVSAYVHNLTNKEYYTGGLGLGAVIGVNSVLPGLPRMLGADASYKF